MRTDVKFDEVERERFLTLMETGRSIAAASEEVSVARETIHKWLRHGRLEDASPEQAEFAARFDAIKERLTPVALSKPDLISLLEAKALEGNVQAMKLLLEKPWNRKAAAEEPKIPANIFDELAAKRQAK